ncbi:MAG: UbiD family decarboxylase, partial [Dehalococcoidia bacterium]|nr:UbiD family decarboxylase [Dehalococcoidia bacterium]
IYYPKYEARNLPMEVAIAIGTDPVCALASAMAYNPGENEVDIAGGLAGEPIELVKCETVDLAVPANSEIVIEGEILPYERRDEGPFGEYTGYMVAERAPRPVIHVKAVTHREAPILTCVCPGVPVEEDHSLRPLAAAGLLNELRSRGFPVKMVYIPPEVGSLLYVVSTKVPFPGYAKHLAHAVWGSSEGRYASWLIIVDDDVDITNLSEVIWALTSRCHPDRGIFKVPNSHGHPLLPFSSVYERRNNLAAQVLFDCTWPKDWPPEAVPIKASFDVLWPKEIQERVLENWSAYGYK